MGTLTEFAETQESDRFVEAVRSLVARRLGEAASLVDQVSDVVSLLPGKMLRTRLIARLTACGLDGVCEATLWNACAATEIVHTASLCHDDVIDNGMMRRGRPTLWQVTSPSGAVLVGDLLLCEAMKLLVEAEGGKYLPDFVEKVMEVIEAEAEQELLWRGRSIDSDTCVRLARGKTGPLFAFAARICAGADQTLASALEEAGYRIGTAYQLADDVLDLVGSEEAAGKTLGTDRARGKLTLPRAGGDGCDGAQRLIGQLCRSALQRVAAYPKIRSGLEKFLSDDLEPTLARHLGDRMELSL